MIITAYDVYRYSIALKNSGITQENIDVLERQFLLLVFGKEGAKRLIEYINANKMPITLPTSNLPEDYEFGGNPVEQPRRWDFGEINELIYGDNILFSGLIALLSVAIALNLESQGRLQIARQNVTKQPVNSRIITRREENEVTQALAFQARNILFALHDYLGQEGKNPLKLEVYRYVEPTRYSTNTSGKMGTNLGFLGIYGGGWY